MTSIDCDQSQLIVATATDGKLVVWRLPQVGEEDLPFSDQDPTWSHTTHQSAITSMSCSRIVNVPISSQQEQLIEDARLILTVGDDSAVALTLLDSFFLTRISSEGTLDHPTETDKVFSIRITNAHAASINAVTITAQGWQDNGGRSAGARPWYWLRIATAGKDQRIRLWDISIPVVRAEAHEGDFDMSLSEVRRAGRIYTQVADVASMELMDPPSQEMRDEMSIVRVLVVGIGMEMLEVEAGQPPV